MVYTGDLKFPAVRLMGSSPIPDTVDKQKHPIRVLLFCLCRGEDLNLHGLTPLAPKASASTNFATSALTLCTQ